MTPTASVLKLGEDPLLHTERVGCHTVSGGEWLCGTGDVPDPRFWVSQQKSLLVCDVPRPPPPLAFCRPTNRPSTAHRLCMLDVLEIARQSPEPTPPPTLADLSRNASVISSSSDSETSTTTVLRTPRPRPTRTFSSPRSGSPQSPPLQTVRPPPAYLTRELDGADTRDIVPEPVSVHRQAQPRSKSRKRSRSQNPSANTRLSAQDFVFGETLGEGSYSTVRTAGVHHSCDHPDV